MNKSTAYPVWLRRLFAHVLAYLLILSQSSLRFSLPPGLLATIYTWTA